MSRTAFVTGAAGFVGEALVRELLHQGWQVTALVRKAPPLGQAAHPGLQFHSGDITVPDSLANAVPRGVDCVFHVAANTSVWSRQKALQTAVNVDGTRNVVEAAIGAGAGKFVHTSSFSVWGFQPGPLDETCAWRMEDGWINYIRTKRLGEDIVKQAVRQGRIDATLCNPAHILGPGDRRNWARMILLVDAGKLPGVPSGGGAFADVREVARAHVRAAEQGRAGENYLLGGEDVEFIDLIRLTGELLGRPTPARSTPALLLRAAARAGVMAAAITGREPVLTPEAVAMLTHHVRCDSSKAARELGYCTTPVRRLLEDTCAWLRGEGLIA